MTIENVKPFDGQHCETTVTGTLLHQLGIKFSEPMLFGLGEGLGFIFWNMKTMTFPFIGGRVKPDELTKSIARNLDLELTVKETSSKKRAWENVKELIKKGQVVGLKLDCYHLEYFSRPIHFAGHYAAIYGYDENHAFLVDTKQQGGKVKTSLASLALARAERGLMSSNNLYYTFRRTHERFDLKKAIVTAIRNNAGQYLNPPIKNIGYKGILKTSSEVIKWYRQSKDVGSDFSTTAMLMEKAGTGGALFRNLYRDFLKESNDLIGLERLKLGYRSFLEIADLWTTVSHLFEMVSQTKEYAHIERASDILRTIAAKEKSTMEMLAVI